MFQRLRLTLGKFRLGLRQALKQIMPEGHQHQWEKVSEAILPSLFERQPGLSRFPNMGGWMYERKHVVIFECKCGKLKRIVEALP